jgi:TolB-like protein
VKRSLFAELRRRNVIRAAVLYIGAVWALAQGIAQLTPVVGAPDWAARWFLVAAAIGFPFWLAFAWFYEFTPEGLKRESEIDPADSIRAHASGKLDRWIFVVMGLAIVLLLTNTFVWRKGAGLTPNALPAPEKSIAVLPFVNMSSDKEQEFFSDGISEELLNLLAKVPSLQVTARTSSFSFKGKEIAVPEIAKSLHVAHILEGSVRKAGSQVRITAQLIDAVNDKHLWSQTYDRKLDDVFAI